MFVSGIGAKWGLDGFEFVRTAPIGATEFDDGFCLVETDAMRSNSKAHVEKMEDRSRRGGKLEVGGEMGAKILELGHPREKTEKIISGEKDVCNTLFVGLRVTTIIHWRANHTKLGKDEMN